MLIWEIIIASCTSNPSALNTLNVSFLNPWPNKSIIPAQYKTRLKQPFEWILNATFPVMLNAQSESNTTKYKFPQPSLFGRFDN